MSFQPQQRDRKSVRITDVDDVRVRANQTNEIGRDLHKRPEPPRGVRFRQGTVYWDAPAVAGNVTHYNVYIDTETNLVARVPGGQTSITGVSGQRVFVSSYNEISRRESRKIAYNGAIWPYAGKTGGVRTHREIQAAIDDLPREGGEVFLAPGEWLVGAAIEIPADKPYTRIVGAGDGTIIKRAQTIEAGKGVFNVRSSNVVLANFKLDGDVTTSAGIVYTNGVDGLLDAGGGNGNPMWATLTGDTSIWVHGGASALLIENVIITHTGGYAVLLDATSSDIEDVVIKNCLFENNRPHKFGNTGDTNYGSWTGGIHFQNNGVSPSTSKVKGLYVEGCAFNRCTGNCWWGHGYGFDVMHEDCSILNCTFSDVGLDAIEPGNQIGGVASGNFGRRVGFIHSTDVDTPVPKYRAGTYAVAMDSTGYVRNFQYVNNTFISVNGGFCDLDGMLESTVANNTFIMPGSGENEYTEDQIASFGLGSGQITKGIQSSSTYQDDGARGLTIADNNIRGCGLAAIGLVGSRECLVTGNQIVHYVNPSVQGVFGVPILIASASASNPNKQAKYNVVRNNRIHWDIPALQINTVVPQSNYCVLESDDVSGSIDPGATVPGPNYVVDNISSGNNYGEFLKGATSSGGGSRHVLPTNAPTATTQSENIIQREGYAASAALKFYSNEAGVSKALAQLQDANAFLNVSSNGSALTGGLVTGNRTSAAFGDVAFSGKIVGDAFWAIKKQGVTGSTYSDTDANLLDGDWALLRFGSGGGLEQSVSVSGGSRVWTAIGGAGGTVAGADKQVQFNDGGSAFGASANFTYDKTLQQVVVTGLTGTAGIATATSFMQSAEGFYTPVASAEAIKAPGTGGSGGGGVAARQYNLYRADGGATGWDTLIDGSRNASFNQVVAEVSVGAVSPSGGNGVVSAQNGFYTPVASSEAVKAPGTSGSGGGGVSARQFNIYRADGGATGFDTVVDNTRSASFTKMSIEATPGTLSPSAGSISTEGGYHTTSTAGNAIQAPSGGVSAVYLTATGAALWTSAVAPGGTAGQGKIWFDSGSGKLRGIDGTGTAYDLNSGGGGTPGGSNTQVQYNNAGAFGGSSDFVFDSASRKVTITTGASSLGLSVSGGYMTTTTGYYVSITQVIDSSRNAYFTSLTVNGTQRIDSSGTFYPAQISVGGVTALDGSRNGNLLALVVGTSITSVGSGTVTSQYGYAVGSSGAGYNSIDTFQNPTGGINVKAVETDYLTLTPQASGIPSTVSGHTPSLKIWYNSSSSRVEIGVSLYTPGISCEGNAVGGNLFRYWNGASYTNGATGTIPNTFTNITVNGGIITAWT